MEQIPIVNQDVGGDFGRKLYFFSDTGKVFVKKLLPQQYTEFKYVEARYTERLLRIKKNAKTRYSNHR
ncbi:MAG: Chemoreceptor glutamine deamidase CheD [Candidatus Methanoperedenaceae archaeon GB50]|nr:MAG: Chemoreceptor glutamine deamidase CheD [Candidatus Methanoperedenaceae archaeon GB50]